jgi:poly-gamma-glutamate synthesis protein (capsule biosynthesis protein)
MVSLHWGPNWGCENQWRHRAFAHALIDEAKVDIVRRHASHHALVIEGHRGGPILYGCGDLINDYKGIADYVAFRPDLDVAYFPNIDPQAGLRGLDLVAFRRHRLRLDRVSHADIAWPCYMLNGDGRAMGRAFREVAGALRLAAGHLAVLRHVKAHLPATAQAGLLGACAEAGTWTRCLVGAAPA